MRLNLASQCRQSPRLGLALFAASAIAAAITHTSLQAAIIYDDGGPVAGAQAIAADTNQPYERDIAVSFELGAGHNVIQGINWWGSYEFFSSPLTPGVDQFAITISTTAYDSYYNVYEPGTLVATVNPSNLGRTATGLLDDQGNRIYAYSTPITPITLSAGVTYMLDFANNTGFQNYSWQYLTSGGSSLAAYLNYGSDDGHWNATSPMAFNLTDNAINTPEPSTVALLVAGATTCMLGRHLSKRRGR